MSNNFLIKPLITERSVKRTKEGLYSFAFSKNSDKKSIKKIIEEQFKVKVISVKTISMHGKKRRKGKKMNIFMSPDWKKAIIKLDKKQKIALFDVTN